MKTAPVQATIYTLYCSDQRVFFLGIDLEKIRNFDNILEIHLTTFLPENSSQNACFLDILKELLYLRQILAGTQKFGRAQNLDEPESRDPASGFPNFRPTNLATNFFPSAYSFRNDIWNSNLEFV